MKSRLFVVDSNSIIETERTNIASIRIPALSGKHWIQTIADIMADLLQIEIGDYIFLWETKKGTQKNRIHGVYRAMSKPYFHFNSNNDKAPFKIHIEKAYDFTETVDEYYVLNNPYMKNILWTITGKKVAGKPRGTTPLSMDEARYLFTLLVGKNPNYTFRKFDPVNVVHVNNPLRISYNVFGNTTRPAQMHRLNPLTIAFFNSSYKVKYEKVLETIFNQELTNKNKALFSTLGINVDNVIWYSNYLPYSIEKKEMDYVVMESDDKNSVSKITLIEFTKEVLDKDHIDKACIYSRWLNDTYGLGNKISRPIIICDNSADFINGESIKRRINMLNRLKRLIDQAEKDNGTKPLEVYTYSISANGITLNKKR